MCGLLVSDVTVFINPARYIYIYIYTLPSPWTSLGAAATFRVTWSGYVTEIHWPRRLGKTPYRGDRANVQQCCQKEGKAGPTRPIPISTKHLCKFFPVWQRWTYDVVAGARTCTTLVGLSLNFTKKCEYWINLALLLYRDLDTGYPSSQSRIFKFKWPNCIQLALKWRVPLMNLLSVNFFAPWLLFITSNIYNQILLVLFSLTVFNMLQLTAAFLLYLKTVRKLQGLSNHVASVSARVRRESCYTGYTNHLEKF